MKEKIALFGGTRVRNKQDKQRFTIGWQEKKAVMKIFETSVLSCFRGGMYVRKFEKEFANFCDCKFGLATTSGTTALHTALAALNLKPEDEVIVPALTFVSTASIVLQENAKVVFADIDETYNIDPKDIEKKITKNTKVIIAVHLFGHPANMPRLQEIANKHSLFLIEDCSQAHGATVNGQKVGSLGDFGCFSFFQTKNMTCGEGGMVTTNNKEMYIKAKLKREHGSSEIPGGTWYNYQELGFNYNMTEIQGAIGLTQLKRLPGFNKKRFAHAKLYQRLLKGTPVTTPITHKGFRSAFHNLPILLPEKLIRKRDLIVDAIKAEGVWVDVCYPIPLYKTQLFIKRGIKGRCPKTESFTSRVITAFTDPLLSIDYIEDTCKAIIKCVNYFLNEE